ncbi:hypothetical protein HGD80_03470 [Paulownia witches'-broom phytoplasma]|uniref:Uncharacterized protein n=1 Tax=Paulownia witches'-broom phytoplasma TaxID=39647 RepID=A0ABX8TQW1_9MOLU|nr:hypothetical protein [Paulownia witches'-broom phytoplasma]QYC30828.1 hypothetical protein HGD80_03470 [Paulownia witches'-broom phytoplasma]
MSDGLTEAYRGTYFKHCSKPITKKKINKYRQPKVKWLNLSHPNKTFKNKKKSFKKRSKILKNY